MIFKQIRDSLMQLAVPISDNSPLEKRGAFNGYFFQRQHDIDMGLPMNTEIFIFFREVRPTQHDRFFMTKMLVSDVY